METTFITIHDLSAEAYILYSSDSIVDILGYTPDEVLHRSCWDFFHPNELSIAQNLHSRGVTFDKAAVLSYCLLRNRQGQWICCECCFTIVYDVMVVCTSIYRKGMTSQTRAVQAPIVRRLFSSSPKDPRYHMLSHLSPRFKQGEKQQTHEPRAALFLNRFTRTLTIMYATAGVEEILGISGEEMKGKSFYYCIQENCLDDAVRCLESAKGNDSIAYLRFWFRDPRIDDPVSYDEGETETETETETDVSMTDATSDQSEDDWRDDRDLHSSRERTSNEPNGTHLEQNAAAADGRDPSRATADSRPSLSASDTSKYTPQPTSGSNVLPPIQTAPSLNNDRNSRQRHFGNNSTPISPETPTSNQQRHDISGVELEAVVSCTSDGLVVCLRRARPVVPTSIQQPAVHQPTHASGIFAAPWATNPVFHPARPDYQYWQMHQYCPPAYGMPGSYPYEPNGYVPPPPGPPAQALFDSIRDTAIFAWALTGINGNLAEFATNPKGATGESQPPQGLQIWKGASKTYDDYFHQRSTPTGSGADSGYHSNGSGNGGGSDRHLSVAPGTNAHPSPTSRNV